VRSQSTLRIVTLAALLCEIATAFAEPGSFAGKLVFFGAKKDNPEASSTICTWSPAKSEVSEIVSSKDESFLRGCVSPDGTMLAVPNASNQGDGSLGAPQLEIVDSKGHRREIGAVEEFIAWYPDFASVLCRRGEQYKWSHVRVGIADGRQTAVPIDSGDAAMDMSADGAICVLKGRPDVFWERQPGDLYPKRQLYFINPHGEQIDPFTDADEDCIWWRFKPASSDGVYYRRHYASGHPVETAMLGEGANHRQLVDFTALGVRPSGSSAWNPNGKEIAWIVTRETKEDDLDFEIMFIPVNGDSPRFVTASELGYSWLGKIDWK
jgi:hypothetical protein